MKTMGDNRSIWTGEKVHRFLSCHPLLADQTSQEIRAMVFPEKTTVDVL
jgi:hypothetical protein